MLDPRSRDFIDAFGRHLIQFGHLDEAALLRAKSAQNKTDERFDFVLIHLGLITESDMARVLADHLAMPRYNEGMLPAAPLLSEQLEPQFLKLNAILPVGMDEKTLTVATADPFNWDAIRAVAYQVDRSVSCVVSTAEELEGAFEQLYDAMPADPHEPGGASESAGEASQEDVDRLREIASEAPVIQLVNQLISKAIESDASDIHIEPLQDRVAIRYRIDGVLQQASDVPQALRAAVISRVKILARLNIAEQRLPQDGRIKHNSRGREIDLRVSTTPTVWGESVVLRILDRSKVNLTLPSLGFEGEILSSFHALLSQPNGIILVTGPTGSGKTTTLYASLEMLNVPERKIFTVEDPVEYQLKGINQIQVKPSIGLDFATALRSILRQDPDIIMIGEIRDLETAQIAVQAALTGHLVFATLHTNSAAATVTRLLDMGVENYLLTSTVIGVLAQRLVRKLCPHCKDAGASACANHRVSHAETADGSVSPGLNGGSHEPDVGCPHCRHTGFSGRTTIAELLVMTDPMRELVMAGRSESEIETAAVCAGMRTMYKHGMEMVASRETTREEVLRVARTG